MKTTHYARIRLGILLSLLAICNMIPAQFPSPKLPPSHARCAHGEVASLSVAQVNPMEITEDWRVTVKRLEISHKGDSLFRAFKQTQNELRKFLPKTFDSSLQEPSPDAPVVTPSIQRNFAGGMADWTIPNDDHMAISNDGKIVSVKNTNIAAFTENGTVLFNMSLNAFANQPNLTSTLYDPKIIYDSATDRFVIVCLHGNASSTSKIVYMVSTSGDPTASWWIYTFNGDLLGNGAWLDYPNLGITTHDIVIGGNLFYDNGNYQQGIMFQFPKADAYAGSTLNGRYWYNITDNAGNPGGTFYPMTYGLQGNYGPQCILMSTYPTNASFVQFWVLDHYNASSPVLDGYSLGIPHYQIGADAQQNGSGALLDVGDCRIRGGFYLYDAGTQTGTTHFSFTADEDNDGDNYNELWYGRVVWVGSSLTPTVSAFGLTGYDYCYPTVGCFGTSGSDQSVMIGFLRSSANTYPEMRVVNCDNGMSWSSSVQAKAGQNAVPSWSGSQRWGDYMGVVRKKGGGTPAVWMSGCYGDAFGQWGTWIAEVTDGTSTGTAPIAHFYGSPTSGYAPLTVSFTDMSQNNPTSWNWNFPGGTPSSSTQVNPTVTYYNPGLYNVSLTTSNAFGSDTETQYNYIDVNVWVGTPSPNADSVLVATTFPNPSTGHFSTEFQVPVAGEITVEIVDVHGRVVKLLYKDVLRAGRHRLTFQDSHLPAGVYQIRIAQNGAALYHISHIVAR
jgi:PKD repeat protein